MKTFQFKFLDQTASVQNYMDFYLKNKATDCILYSEDGSKFKIHKELFGQTDFLREILSSTKEHCCGTIEVFCPCSKGELSHLVNFLYDGEIHCEGVSDSLKIIENLQKIFGFARNLDLNYPNGTFFTSDNNIEAMTITEEVYENILEASNVDKIVIIPLRSKKVNVKLVTSDQGNEGNSLVDGKKKVSEKKKKSMKIFQKQGSAKKKSPQKFQCNDCGASFALKRHLQRHINAVHLKLKPYVCDQCKKSFSRKDDLNMHIKSVHLKIRPHKCQDCSRNFLKKMTLASHVERVHLKPNPLKRFICNKCETAFHTKRNLKNHMDKIHLKTKSIKNFKCNECDAPFEHKQHLELHINKIHLNVKPYECNFCQKAFFIKAQLKTHLKRFHGEEEK